MSCVPARRPSFEPESMKIFLNLLLSATVKGGRGPDIASEDGPATGSVGTGEMFSSTAKGPAM